MSDLVLFRIARAPQRRIPDPVSLVEVGPRDRIDEWLQSSDVVQLAATWLIETGITPTTTRLQLAEGDLAAPLAKLRALDRELARVGNRTAVEQVEQTVRKLYDRRPRDLVGKQDWLDLRRFVSEALVATAVVAAASPDLRSDLTRLMLVVGLVELLAAGHSPLRTPDDVYWALRWRTVVLPEELLYWLRQSRPQVARRPGFADLYLVRDEWNRYEPGEIAHIENVLPGEQKDRTHLRIDETEQITITERERAETSERDSQTTDRFDLHDASSTDVSLAVHVEGKVDTSGQYGPTHVDTHLGGSLDYSQEQADQHATEQSRESVSRAVTRVEERTREARMVRTLTRVEETNAHRLHNSATNDPVVGIYRWVDKVQRVQVFRYPHRFLTEFEVPEPGAWWRWLEQRKAGRSLLTAEPTPLTVDGTPGGTALTAADVKPDSYLALGARYSTLGLTAPPGDRVVALALRKDSVDDPGTTAAPKDKQAIRFATDATMAVPEGYQAVSWTATVHSWHNYRFGNDGASVRLSVGGGAPQQVGSDSKGGSIDKVMSGQVGSVSSGSIPVAVMTDAVAGFAIDLAVTCTPLTDKLTAWRVANYDRITSAYYALKRQRQEELAARAIAGGVQIEGASPERNREIIRAELKRQVIELLTGAPFGGRPAITADNPNATPPTGPHIDPEAAGKVAAEIQFLEQAFEWENLSYVLYPHYWADEDRWADLADLDGNDPEFARFLRSGSARVVLPARPGFAAQAQLYVDTGILWGGGPIPAPGEEGYLSIAEEIKAQQQPPADGEAGESWEVRLPTQLVWVENEAGLPANPKPKLDAPPGKQLGVIATATPAPA